MSMINCQSFDSVTLLTINRPECLNAINWGVLEELDDYFKSKKDDPHLKVVILTGAGSKAFIAGADIGYIATLDAEKMVQFCHFGQKLTHFLATAPFITIAAVNGYALGGGFEFALACDFLYASHTAKLGLPEVSLGLVPGFGGLQRLIQAVGVRQAKWLLLNSTLFSAEEGQAMGIVHRCCEPDQLVNECMSQAERCLANNFQARIKVKKAINNSQTMSFEAATAEDGELCALSLETEECRLAMKRFLYK